jgi:two-component system, OmpR family, response regulator
VDGANDGRAGIERAVRGTYDLVILDLLLPKLDGFAVLRQLQNRLPELPVVIVSARSELETKLRGFDLGACDYLSKPFSFDELLARVRAQLRRGRPGENGSVVHAGSLSLDVARRQAKLGDVVAALSDREFRLLHHLVLHEGEVVSRERLLADVWGYHFDPRSNVVEVCMRRLRQKLGADSPIETVRHGGYRLTAA